MILSNIECANLFLTPPSPLLPCFLLNRRTGCASWDFCCRCRRLVCFVLLCFRLGLATMSPRWSLRSASAGSAAAASPRRSALRCTDPPASPAMAAPASSEQLAASMASSSLSSAAPFAYFASTKDGAKVYSQADGAEFAEVSGAFNPDSYSLRAPVDPAVHKKFVAFYASTHRAKPQDYVCYSALSADALAAALAASLVEAPVPLGPDGKPLSKQKQKELKKAAELAAAKAASEAKRSDEKEKHQQERIEKAKGIIITEDKSLPEAKRVRHKHEHKPLQSAQQRTTPAELARMLMHCFCLCPHPLSCAALLFSRLRSGRLALTPASVSRCSRGCTLCARRDR